MTRNIAAPATRSETPDWLTTPIEFEDPAAIRARRMSMRIVVLFVAAALVWAGVAPIREHSIAHGQLVPLHEVRPVQHLEGGIVDRILVSEGQVVEKGEPLLRLQPVGMASDLAALRARAHNLMLGKARAGALLADRNLDPQALFDIDPALVSEHARVHQLRLQQRAKESEVLETRMAQKRAEIAGLETQIPMQTRLAEMQKERLEGRQKLFSEGVMSRKQVLEVETLYEQARIQLRESERRLAMAKEALPEAKAALAEADAQARKLWSEELANASGELAEVQESIRKQADRVDRLVVRAPIRGRVQNLQQRSPGDVVPPGETILRVVPVGGDLVAEVRVKPEDIAEVKVGDTVEIKISAFDFTRYGKLKGEVSSISATTFETGEHQLFYKAVIRLDPARTAAFAPYWRLQAGMTVEADIISGSKSLLRYMLKPVFRGMDVAFSER